VERSEERMLGAQDSLHFVGDLILKKISSGNLPQK